MNVIAVNEHLAQLLLVQGGLLDAYLEQNLGTRYAYAILVCETASPRRVRAVTNFANPAPIRALLADLAAASAVESGEAIAVDRSPRFVDVA
jgi:hypothetical protein